MSEQKTTNYFFSRTVEGLNYITKHLEDFNESIKRDEEEIKKLNSIIDELRDENERLKKAAKGGEA